ncbi:MAG: alpha/beta fold hydrolase [Mesorhizobium sp.]|nr:alpha/beta fold hydrolase [Mesorhizobium sp.]
MILIHGNYGSWRHWSRNIAELGRRYTVYMPDLPGFGDSGPMPEPTSIESLAEIVAQGIEAIVPHGLISLLGFSYGSVVAGWVARRLSQRVERIMLVGGIGLRLPRNWPELMAVRSLSEEQLRGTHADNLERLMIADRNLITEEAVDIQLTNVTKSRAGNRVPWREGLLADALETLSVPIHFIWGERDALVAGHLPCYRAALETMFPGCTVDIIPRAGHWVQFESPDEFHILWRRHFASEGN